jgi:hypothetical protein
LEEFRQHLGGELTITLLEDIGRGIEVHTMETPVVIQVIQELEQRRKNPGMTRTTETKPVLGLMGTIAGHPALHHLHSPITNTKGVNYYE